MRPTRLLLLVCPLVSILAGVIPHLVVRFQVDVEEANLLESNMTLAHEFFACTPSHLIASKDSRFSAAATDFRCPTRHGVELDATDVPSNTYRFTRQRAIFRSMELHRGINPVQVLTQQKEFVWTSISAGEWLFGVAMLRFNYNNGVVIQLYNSKQGLSLSKQIELPGIAPFVGPVFRPNHQGHTSLAAVGHCIEFDSLSSVFGTTITLCVRKRGQRTVAHLNLTTTFDHCAAASAREPGSCSVPFALDADLALDNEVDFTSLVFPLGKRRASLVTKVAAAPVADVRVFSIDNKPAAFHPASIPLFSIDYTRGLLRRLTVWKWASMSAVALDRVTGQRVPVGFHLSTGTYDFHNASVESAVYGPPTSTLPGKPPPPPPPSPPQSADSAPVHVVNFLDDPSIEIRELHNAVAPRTPHRNLWRIYGCGGALDLTFTPAGPHFHGDFHYSILDGDLYHMWGTYTGRVPRVVSPADSGGSRDSRSASPGTKRGCCGPTAGDGRDVDACSLHVKDAPGVLEDHYALW